MNPDQYYSTKTSFNITFSLALLCSAFLLTSIFITPGMAETEMTIQEEFDSYDWDRLAELAWEGEESELLFDTPDMSATKASSDATEIKQEGTIRRVVQLIRTRIVGLFSSSPAENPAEVSPLETMAVQQGLFSEEEIASLKEKDTLEFQSSMSNITVQKEDGDATITYSTALPPDLAEELGMEKNARLAEVNVKSVLKELGL